MFKAPVTFSNLYNLMEGKNSSQWKPIVVRDSRKKQQHTQKTCLHTAYVVLSKSMFTLALARVVS